VITEKLIFKIPYEIADVPDYDVIFGANYYEDWNADLGVSDSGGLVDSWTSQGLNGGVFGGSGATRPSVVSGLGGSVIEFDGVSENLIVSGSTGDYNFLHDTNGGCVIIVYSNLVTPAAQSQLVSNTFSGIGFRILHNSASVVNTAIRNAGANIAINATTETTTNTEYNSFVNVHDPNNATLLDRIESVTNGISGKFNTTSGTPTASNASNNLTVGKRADASSFYLNGRVKRVIIADTIPTPTQLAQVQARLIYDYGTFPIT